MSEAAKRRYSTALGYLTSLCGPVVSFPSTQPTAYSYNGVVLPKLPEWDKTVYPYAWIRGYLSSRAYLLYFQSEISYVQNETGTECIRVADSDLKYIWFSGYTSWEISSVAGDSATESTVWANFDVLNTSGELVMQASDPIPVYE